MKKKHAIIASLFFFMSGIVPDVMGQWVQTNANIFTHDANSFVVSDTNFLVGTTFGIFRMVGSGTNWAAISMGLNKNHAIWTFVENGTSLFAGTADSGVFRSLDNGATWAKINSGMSNRDVRTLAIIDTNLFAGAFTGTYDGGVFRSTNNGNNWTSSSKGLSDTNVVALAVIGNYLFAGTFGGGVFLSTDFGDTWNAANLGLTNKRVRVLAVIGTDLFVGTEGSGIFRSSNNAMSWTDVSGGLSNKTILTILVYGQNLFAGTFGGGAFLSSNRGTSWVNVGGIYSNASFSAFGVSDTNLFAGVDGGTVGIIARRTISEMISVNSVVPVAKNLPVVSSFPNPFSQSTSIKFTSTDRAFTQVSIHNLLGSEVARLFTGSLDGGEHSFTWDAQSMPPGMYICTIRASGRTEELPVMLVK